MPHAGAGGQGSCAVRVRARQASWQQTPAAAGTWRAHRRSVAYDHSLDDHRRADSDGFRRIFLRVTSALDATTNSRRYARALDDAHRRQRELTFIWLLRLWPLTALELFHFR